MCYRIQGFHGDAAVQALIDQGIMKQWEENGVVYASYRTVSVSEVDTTIKKKEIQKAFKSDLV